MKAVEFYRAAFNNKGLPASFLDINTITHREKPIRGRVTQVLYKQIFQTGSGSPLVSLVSPTPCYFILCQLQYSLQGHWRQTKEKDVRGREEGRERKQSPLLAFVKE